MHTPATTGAATTHLAVLSLSLVFAVATREADGVEEEVLFARSGIEVLDRLKCTKFVGDGVIGRRVVVGVCVLVLVIEAPGVLVRAGVPVCDGVCVGDADCEVLGDELGCSVHCPVEGIQNSPSGHCT